MKTISGTFNGTGAALRIGLGFIPDYVRIYNLEDAGGLAPKLEFAVNSRSADQEEGVLLDSSGGRTELTNGNGVAIFRGLGTEFAAAQTAYLVRDTLPDKRSANADASPINAWTLGNSGNRTGNFNAEANTTHVGEGSRIAIRPRSFSDNVRWATITAMTSNGDQANEVTLNEAIGSGDILFIQGLADYVGLKADTPMRDGFVINEASVLNQSGELCFFEAGAYTNDH